MRLFFPWLCGSWAQHGVAAPAEATDHYQPSTGVQQAVQDREGGTAEYGSSSAHGALSGAAEGPGSVNSVEYYFGPDRCVSVSLSPERTCQISTHCEGTQLIDFEFRFLCVTQGRLQEHSFGVGGFSPTEVYNTQVSCDACKPPTFQSKFEVAPDTPSASFGHSGAESEERGREIALSAAAWARGWAAGADAVAQQNTEDALENAAEVTKEKLDLEKEVDQGVAPAGASIVVPDRHGSWGRLIYEDKPGGPVDEKVLPQTVDTGNVETHHTEHLFQIMYAAASFVWRRAWMWPDASDTQRRARESREADTEVGRSSVMREDVGDNLVAVLTANQGDAVFFGPDFCVATYLQGGTCIMETKCSQSVISGLRPGFVCESKQGMERHLYNVGDFDAIEVFDSRISCDRCLGLEEKGFSGVKPHATPTASRPNNPRAFSSSHPAPAAPVSEEAGGISPVAGTDILSGGFARQQTTPDPQQLARVYPPNPAPAVSQPTTGAGHQQSLPGAGFSESRQAANRQLDGIRTSPSVERDGRDDPAVAVGKPAVIADHAIRSPSVIDVSAHKSRSSMPTTHFDSAEFPQKSRRHKRRGLGQSRK